MEDKKWYRVTDPLSPLHGCDVRGEPRNLVNIDMSFDRFLIVEALRRVDIFAGDRPFQLIAPDGKSLGMMIEWAQLAESPLQDDIVELATDLPYGACLDEYEAERGDEVRLHVATFERAAQVALTHKGKLLRSETYKDLTVPNELVVLFEDGQPVDTILERMVGA